MEKTGLDELNWMVGSGGRWPEWDERGERLLFREVGEGKEKRVMALQKRMGVAWGVGGRRRTRYEL